jgi:hypothetical protein
MGVLGLHRLPERCQNKGSERAKARSRRTNLQEGAPERAVTGTALGLYLDPPVKPVLGTVVS